MYSLLKPILFCFEAETSHNLVLGGLRAASKSKSGSKIVASLAGVKPRSLPVEAMGIQFPNPVGLAAGLDKQGDACNALHQMGFGFIELGTVTPKPQPGNPKPRMFRLTEHQAIINRMGFNSIGLDEFVKNVSMADDSIIKGINIGKNASTPLSSAVDDYVVGLNAVYRYADYVTINISSPNTKNLRALQNDDALERLLGALSRTRQRLADAQGRYVPMVIKIAPDIDDAQVDRIASILRRYKMDGVAATNTTVSRRSIENHRFAAEVGGISGRPLQAISTQTIKLLHQNLQDEIPIIGIGGIVDAESAIEKLQAGAKLIQIYTGLIYRGPKLIGEILNRLP